MTNGNFTRQIVQTINQFKFLVSFNKIYINYIETFVNKPLKIELGFFQNFLYIKFTFIYTDMHVGAR